MGIDAELLIRNPKPMTERAVRELSVALVEAFGVDNFGVSPKGRFGENDPGQHALQTVSIYEQDGPSIRPREGEQLIRVSLLTRYYGEGYERGDLPTIIAVTEWLEYRLPSVEIWYGGDSSGVTASPFSKEDRRALFEHFCRVGHRPYTSGFGKEGRAQTCEFCADNEMIQCRWGGAGIGYVCAGCNLHRLVKHDGSIAESYRHWPDQTPEQH